MALWNHPGDSVYRLAARSHRVVGAMGDMLGGEVYHYHSKLTAKEPHDGGAVKAVGVKLSSPGAAQFRNASARPAAQAVKAS